MNALDLASKAWKTALSALGIGQALQQVLTNNASVAGASVENLASPASKIIAAFSVTPVRSGVFSVTVNYNFTDSAADTVSLAIAAQATETAFSGGTLITASGAPMALRVAETTDVVATASGSSAINGTTSETQAGAGASQLNLAVTTQALPLGVTSIIVVEVTATHNLSAQVISARASELP